MLEPKPIDPGNESVKSGGGKKGGKAKPKKGKK